jgi:hypothetical protein
MKQEQMRHLVIALSAFLLSPLCAAAGGSAGSPRSPNWIELSAGVTNLLRWDAGTLAAFDSQTGEVFALPVPDSNSESLDLLIDLDLPPAKSSGTVFPDPLLRSDDGRLFLLNKGQGEIFEFDRQGGFIRRIPVPFPATHHLALTADGSPLIVGHCLDRECAGSSTWSEQNGWSAVRPSWLSPHPEDNQFTAAFVFPPADSLKSWVELPLHFPWVRIVGQREHRAVSYLECDAVPDFVKRAIEEQAETHGLPEPLGSGFDTRGGLYPVLLAAVRQGSTVHGVLNGRVAIEISIDDPTKIECSLLPAPPGDCSSGVAKALAVSADSVAYLYGCPGRDGSWSFIIDR